MRHARSATLSRMTAQIPIIAVIAAYLVWTAFITRDMLSVTDGHLVYTLDDTYIHLAVAKNIVQHGTYGVLPNAFSASSSSPIWPFLLAGACAVAGISEWIPLAIALLFAVLSILAAYAYALRLGASPLISAGIAGAAAYLSAMPLLVSTGLEHTMHIFALVVVLTAAVRTLQSGDAAGRLFAATAFAAAVRYETAFLAGPLFVLLVIDRRWKAAVAVAAGLALPFAANGIFLAGNGAALLPDTLLLRGRMPQFDSLAHGVAAFGYHGFSVLMKRDVLYAAALGAAAFAFLLPDVHRTQKRLLLAFAFAVVLHLQFAEATWFFRHEGYLLFLGTMLIGSAIALYARDRAQRPDGAPRTNALSFTVLVLLLASPLFYRAKDAMALIPQASKNIRDQQYAMSEFTRTHVPAGTLVAMNDIGCVSFRGNIEILDLVGIGDTDVSRLRRAEPAFDAGALRRLLLARHADYVIVYREWFSIPQDLILVGTWSITNNVVCGGATVSLYATRPDAARRLREWLLAYVPDAPRDVTIRVTDAHSIDSLPGIR